MARHWEPTPPSTAKRNGAKGLEEAFCTPSVATGEWDTVLRVQQMVPWAAGKPRFSWNMGA